MFSSKFPSIFLGILLYFSSRDAAADKLDPSKYTVTFVYNGTTKWCHGGIMGKKTLISAAECFGDRRSNAFNFTSVKAVVGFVEVEVDKVMLPKYPPSEGKVLHDYAMVYLKEELKLKENGLVALNFPNGETKINSWGSVGKDDGKQVRKYKIVGAKHCPNRNGMTFIAESHLCVELPNPYDNCLDQLGSPMVARGQVGLKVIGIYLDCYRKSRHEVFANVYSNQPGEFHPYHFYPQKQLRA